jgi:hypothetical protein
VSYFCLFFSYLQNLKTLPHEFFTIKERGNWQAPVFFAMSAYIYRVDEGLQVCISGWQAPRAGSMPTN